MFFLMILFELVRLYLLGLIVFLTLSILCGVSISGLVAATSVASVASLPLVVGAWTSFGIDTGRFVARKARGVHSWICSHKA